MCAASHTTPRRLNRAAYLKYAFEKILIIKRSFILIFCDHK